MNFEIHSSSYMNCCHPKYRDYWSDEQISPIVNQSDTQDMYMTWILNSLNSDQIEILILSLRSEERIDHCDPSIRRFRTNISNSLDKLSHDNIAAYTGDFVLSRLSCDSFYISFRVTDHVIYCDLQHAAWSPLNMR